MKKLPLIAILILLVLLPIVLLHLIGVTISSFFGKDAYLLFFLALALLIFIYDSFKKKEKQK